MAKLKRLLIWLLRVAFLLFALLPIYGGLILALTPYERLMEPLLTPKYLHFENFIHLLTRTPFPYWIRNSIFYSMSSVILVIILAIPIAYGFARKNIFRNKIFFFKSKVFLFVLLIVQMIAPILIMPSLYMLFRSLGLLNSIVGVILVLTGVNLSLTTLLLIGFFSRIPSEIEESAMIDGASLFQVFFKIVLPLAAPGIAVSAMFAFINTYNEFVVPLFLLNQEGLFPMTVGLTNMLGDVDVYWHLIASGSIVGLLPPLIFFLIAHRYIIEGLTTGATKF